MARKWEGLLSAAVPQAVSRAKHDTHKILTAFPDGRELICLCARLLMLLCSDCLLAWVGLGCPLAVLVFVLPLFLPEGLLADVVLQLAVAQVEVDGGRCNARRPPVRVLLTATTAAGRRAGPVRHCFENIGPSQLESSQGKFKFERRVMVVG